MILNENVLRRLNKLLIDTDECINYPILNRDGYGLFQTTGTNREKLRFLMHRVSYQVFTKEDINSNDIICHICDNPACINPKHLFKGTHADNVRDRVNKNRSASGENNGRYIDGRSKIKVKKEHHHSRKFNFDTVRQIRAYRKAGLTLEQITIKVPSATLSNIKDICSNRTYTESIYYD